MKENYKSITTPMGIAIYPWLIKADTKFNPLGEYKVSLSLSEKDAEPIKKDIDKCIEEARSLVPEGKKVKESDPPYFNETDDDGQDTGNVVFKFKMKAKIQTKDNRTLTMSPKIFDSQGTIMKPEEDIWGGSKMKINADIIPYYVPAIGCGVSLRLKAVQIIELVTGDSSNATNYGFVATEGFTTSVEGLDTFDSKDDQEDF